MLSKFHPVGIMVYGSAEFMGVPWEIIIKVYRSRLGARNFDKLEQFAKDFFEHLDQSRLLFSDSRQRSYFRRMLSGFFWHIRGLIQKRVEETLKTSNSLSDAELATLVNQETLVGSQLLKKVLTRSRFRFDAVACVINRSEIIQSLSARSIEVALVNESLQDGPFMGFQVLNELRASFPDTKVIILLKSAPRDLVVDAFRAGAKGVFCKAEPIQALCKCIVAVHNGQIGANNQQLHFILEALVSATPLRVIDFQRRYLLAKREDDVANLVTEGLPIRRRQRSSVSASTL
jgi:two-component system nitrate/nitrite response regulator NarL